MQFGHVAEGIPEISQVIVTFGANLLVHSTLLICTGFLAVYLFRRYGAVVQSLILRATLVAVLACPIVALVLHDSGKSLTVNIPTVYPDTPASSPADITNITHEPAQVHMEPVLNMVPPVREDVPTVDSPESMPPLVEMFWVKVVQPQSIDLKMVMYIVLTGGWFIMSFVAFGRLFLDTLSIYWLRRNAYDADIDVLKRAKGLARELEIDPPIILLSPDVGSPFVSGFTRPVLFVPMDIEVTREVLIHEYGHLIRNDYLWNLCGHVISALMPFPVMVRLLTSRLEDISDYICDDYVVTHSHSSRPYLQQLVSIAERFCPTRMERVFGVGIIRIRSAIGKRIQRLVNRTGTVFITARLRVIFLVAMITAVATLLTGLVSIDAYQELAYDDGISFELNTMSAPANGFYQEWQRSARFTRPAMIDETLDKPVMVDETLSEKENNSSQQIATVPVQPSEAETGQSIILDDVTVAPAQPAVSGTVHSDSDSISQNENVVADSDDPVVAFIEVLEERTVLTDEFIQYVNSMKTVKECVDAGEKMLDNGDYARAEQVFVHALTMDSKNPKIHNYLGMTYYRLRKYDQALVSYKNAVALNDKYSVAYFNMGDVLFELGDLDKAMKYYKIAISMNPALKRNNRPFYLGQIVRQVKY